MTMNPRDTQFWQERTKVLAEPLIRKKMKSAMVGRWQATKDILMHLARTSKTPMCSSFDTLDIGQCERLIRHIQKIR